MAVNTQISPVSTASPSGLPPGWRMVRFGDVVSNANEQERNALENGIERYVGLDHLEPGSLHIKRWGMVAEGTTFTRKFVNGQVLFAKRRAYQRKVAVADFAGICSGDILVFETKSDMLLPELLPFIVESDGFFDYALQTSAGSLSPRTRWNDLAKYEFPLPPKEEQRRIADILWAADEAVEKWTATTLLHDSIRSALISRRVFEKPNSRCERIPLGDLLESIRYGTSVRSYRSGEGQFPIVGMPNVTNGSWTPPNITG